MKNFLLFTIVSIRMLFMHENFYSIHITFLLISYIFSVIFISIFTVIYLLFSNNYEIYKMSPHYFVIMVLSIYLIIYNILVSFISKKEINTMSIKIKRNNYFVLFLIYFYALFLIISCLVIVYYSKSYINSY